MAPGGNILPVMKPYEDYPGMEGAIYYYYGFPEEPDERLARRRAQEALQRRRRISSPPAAWRPRLAVVAAIKKAGGTDTEKLIAAMEGLEFDTPKGKMTFRKEDHQAHAGDVSLQGQGERQGRERSARAGARDSGSRRFRFRSGNKR